MKENPNRAEAERLLGVAEKLLHSRDLNGTKDFAVLAQEAEPLLEGPDQILAVADVLLSAEKRVNNHHDWYSILQIERRSDDNDLIKKQYRRLALLLHPDKNKYPFSDQAFKLVADAWAVLSDSAKKSVFDNELGVFSRVDLTAGAKLPVWRSQTQTPKKQGEVEKPKATSTVDNSARVNSTPDNRSQKMKLSSFWTACPYCYILYEYPRVYENCCLRCQNCQRAFHAALVPSLPPLVPGKEAYYCCWGFFPLGFMFGSADSGEGKSNAAAEFPNWLPQMFGNVQQDGNNQNGAPTPAPMAVPPARVGVQSAPPARVGVDISGGNVSGVVPRKRGRPRKNPVQT